MASCPISRGRSGQRRRLHLERHHVGRAGADGDWISDAAKGITIADATSAAFAQEIDWQKLDVATFSWQKVLGGEGAHGVLILGPRAVERLEGHTPLWPLPKIFRMTSGGKLNEGIFKGDTINTPSMLAVEDYIFALEWAQGLGGLHALIARADANAAAVDAWVGRTPWIEHLARDPATRSNTSVCLRFAEAALPGFDGEAQAALVKRMAACWKPKARPSTWRATATRRRASHLVRSDGGNGRYRTARPWLDWAFAEAATASTSPRKAGCPESWIPLRGNDGEKENQMPKVLISDQMDPERRRNLPRRGRRGRREARPLQGGAEGDHRRV
jgi:phosphoserine aminotransferase